MKYVSGVNKRISEHGLSKGLQVSVSEGAEIILEDIGEHLNYGRSPFHEEWDILVLLDACRSDLFFEFGSDHPLYSRFTSVESRYSPASTSMEWMQKVYRDAPEDVLADTHLVSANGWEPKELTLSEFGAISPVWEHHDTDIGTIRPDRVTDAAIHAGRRTNCSKIIVHYMQPHAPFLHAPGKYDSVNQKPGEGKSQNVWEGLREGRYSVDEVWEDYGKNLVAVLNEVERLAENIDGEMVVSADHANALGEFGVYGHPSFVPVPALKRVPWARLRATDSNTSQPGDPITPGVSDRNVEEHLRDLGYQT